MKDLLASEQIAEFERTKELDCAYAVPQLGRFRVNVRQQRGVVGITMRAIAAKIPNLKDLSVPDIVGDVIQRPRGLVLVTGSMGSGKSTTMAAMINQVNETREGHIITVEDPIEYLHPNKSCLVEQREVGTDTESFASALKHALRQDCNVLMLGEMRDFETVEIALTAAETGMLVMGTLHTNDAVQSIERIINVFPGERQAQARMQLAMALEAVICQQLLPRSDGMGRALAVEILVATTGVRNMIRKGETAQMRNVLATGGESGMVTMDRSLANLYRDGAIAYQTALGAAVERAELESML